MMDQNRKVEEWLVRLPEFDASEYCTTSANYAKKRKAASQRPEQQLTSPPESLLNMDATPTRKRQRIRDVDVDLTPRPGDLQAMGPAEGSIRSSATSSRSTQSRSLSPKKQMMGLNLDDKGLECRQLEIDTAPAAMSQILETMREILHGHEILPDDRRDDILESVYLQNSSRREWRYSFRPPGEPDTLPGRIPSIEEVALIYEMARECQNFGHDEAGWNVEVHHRLLQSIFRGWHSSGGINDTNFAICTTARPHTQYLPQNAPAKMVDFCVYADLSKDNQMSQALRNLSRQSPTLSVNHTDFRPFQLRPITLSIETKKPGKELEMANLQIGLWHSAQWSFLKFAATLSSRARQCAEGLVGEISSLDRMKMAKDGDDAINRLPFIPGVVVQGHKWSLVISTRHEDKTILWTEREFGSTQSVQEIFKIVAGLREITAWFRAVYLPWLQGEILQGFLD